MPEGRNHPVPMRSSNVGSLKLWIQPLGSFGAVDADKSLMADIGGAVAFIFKPLGFGTWQAVARICDLLLRKESFPRWEFCPGLGAIEDHNASMSIKDFDAFLPNHNSSWSSFLMFNLLDSTFNLAALSTLLR